MWDSGTTTKHVVGESFCMLMAMFTMECGRAIKRMATESTQTLEAQNMKASGETTNRMARDMKPGLKAPLILVTT